MSMHKIGTGQHEDQEYLGDGVYAEFDGYQVWVFILDGLQEVARIAIPNDGTWEALQRYAKRHYDPQPSAGEMI